MRKLISVVLSHQVRGNWLRRPQEVAAGKQAASRPRKDAGGGGPAEGTREGAAGTRTPHLGRLSIQLPSPISITQASTHGPAQARAPPKGGIRPPAAAQPAVRAFPARTPPPSAGRPHTGARSPPSELWGVEQCGHPGGGVTSSRRWPFPSRWLLEGSQGQQAPQSPGSVLPRAGCRPGGPGGATRSPGPGPPPGRGAELTQPE